jgi:hypothetical protein
MTVSMIPRSTSSTTPPLPLRLVAGCIALLVFLAEFFFGIELIFANFFLKDNGQLHTSVFTLAMLVTICYALALAIIWFGYGVDPAPISNRRRVSAPNNSMKMLKTSLDLLLIGIFWAHIAGFLGLFLMVAQRFILNYQEPEYLKFFILSALSGAVAIMSTFLGDLLLVTLSRSERLVQRILSSSLQAAISIFIITMLAQIGLWIYRNVTQTLDSMKWSTPIILALALFVVNAGYAIFLIKDEQ